MAKATDMKKENTHAAEARDIERQLHKMREKAESLAGSITTMGAAELRSLKAKTAHFLEEAREHGGDYVREASHKAQENMSETIRSKPLTSVAVAAGIGFVLALLASR